MHLSGVKAYNTLVGQSSVYLSLNHIVALKALILPLLHSTTVYRILCQLMENNYQYKLRADFTVLSHTDLVSAWLWIVLVGG